MTNSHEAESLNPPPEFSLLIKPMGYDCNLDCKYCFYSCTDVYYPELAGEAMPDDVVERLVKDYLSKGFATSVFCWQGGEPTMAGLDFFRQVVAFQKKYGASGQVVGNALQTNGILITEEWARFLKDYNFLVGLSLDGPQEVHDHYRHFKSGGGTFERVMKTADIFRKHGVSFNILSTVHAASRGKGREIYNWLISQGFDFLQFIPILEPGDKPGEWRDFSIDPEGYGEFLCDLFDAWYENGYPNVSIRLFENMISFFVTGHGMDCTYRKSCMSYLLVERNGDVYPCDFYMRPEWKLGNLMEAPIYSFFGNEKQQEFSMRKVKNRDKCFDCQWYALCCGDCLKLRNSDEEKGYLCEGHLKFFDYTQSRFLKIADDLKQRQAMESAMPAEPYPTDVGRNASCPCGSGRKYKKCCLSR